jgi:hypothetical protein
VTDPNLPEEPGTPVPPPSPPAPAYGEPAAPAYGQTAPAYGQPATAYGQPTGTRTNTLAIISLVASLVGIATGIGFIAGIICGHISLSQIKKTGEEGRGMAIAGLVIGYIGVVLFILGMILLFTFLGVLAASGGIPTQY